MKSGRSRSRAWGTTVKHVVSPFVNAGNLIRSAVGYLKYFEDMGRYMRMAGAERIDVRNAYPCVLDSFPSHPFDTHYLYQDAWAMRRIVECHSEWHIDVGSRLDFVALLSTCIRTEFVDIRRLDLGLEGLEAIQGDILHLPFADDSVSSLSCLHVAEHIGLGRYGDPLDPNGTRKACAELARVLAPRSQLYFSLPVGRPRLCFNAHRIHSPDQVLDFFDDLEMVEFSAVTDEGAFTPHAHLEDVAESEYACGMFVFHKT